MFVYYRTSLVRVKFLCFRPLVAKTRSQATTPSVQKTTSQVNKILIPPENKGEETCQTNKTSRGNDIISSYNIFIVSKQLF